MRGSEDRGVVMVTGGAGFLGSNLCRRLLRDGAAVHCVDNLVTAQRYGVDLLRDHDRFRFFEMDVADQRFIWKFSGTPYREIYHLACPTGVPNIGSLGEEMMETCSAGTTNVLKLARLSGARVLLTSSCEVYGDPAVFPQSESYTGNVDTMGPRSAYEEGKRFSEALIALYHRKYGVDGRIVRIFNTYGSFMSPEDQRVIPQFLSRHLKKQRVTVFGDGSQRRTFLYVDDLLAGFEAVMRRGEAGTAYNIGGSESITIRELCEIVARAVDGHFKVEFKPHFIADHAGRMPDLTRIHATGWRQAVGLADGLRISLDSMRERIRYASRSSRRRELDRIEPNLLGSRQSSALA
jgi:nucleoside-diphosphate-sugar epimerase